MSAIFVDQSFLLFVDQTLFYLLQFGIASDGVVRRKMAGQKNIVSIVHFRPLAFRLIEYLKFVEYFESRLLPIITAFECAQVNWIKLWLHMCAMHASLVKFTQASYVQLSKLYLCKSIFSFAQNSILFASYCTNNCRACAIFEQTTVHRTHKYCVILVWYIFLNRMI